MDVSKMEKYFAPVPHNQFGTLSISLCGLGLFFMAYFFVMEVTSSKYSRSFVKELLVAAIAALLLGFGSVFLLLWVGIYV